MKLPDENMLLVGRVGHGCFWADKPATLSDIRAAAKEMGYAVVALSDLLRCHDTGYWTDEMSEYIENEQDAKKQKPRFISHYGGSQPVGDDVMVEVAFRMYDHPLSQRAINWRWSHVDAASDIIAYRVLGENE